MYEYHLDSQDPEARVGGNPLNFLELQRCKMLLVGFPYKAIPAVPEELFSAKIDCT